MKKNLFIVAAVALVAMVSCNKEEINNGGVDTTPEPAVVVEFEAGFNADTKTALDAEGKKTLWEADDLISINGQQFKIKELLNDGANAVFVNVNNLPDDFAAPFNAVYPYGSNGIPATQTAKANTFDPAAAIETATSDNNTLVFANQSSLLKFQVPAACSSVSLTADENLAQDSKTVTISGNFAAGTDYYVAVLPGTKTNFVARIDGYVSKNAATVTIAKSSIVNMKTLPAPKASGAYLKGSFNSWGGNDALYVDLDGWYIIKNVEINNNAEFKFEKSGNWTGFSGTFYLNNYANTKKGEGDNIKINNGKYDFYFHEDENSIYVTTAGGVAPGVSRPIRLLVNNSGGKNSLRVYMWDSAGNAIIGAWNDRPYMTSTVQLNGTSYNYYELDVQYYGQTLNYKLTWDGGDSGDVTNVYFGQDNYYDLY